MPISRVKKNNALQKLTYIWEGSFKNLHRNVEKLINGETSSSRGATPFYEEKELVTKKTHVTGSYSTPQPLAVRNKTRKKKILPL
tara:strand:- start:47 stop:301 length:255 start_codon:yes stop_codon:yes gene_type:complete